MIHQKHSWTTLNISRELLEELLKTHGVFADFWRCVFTFGFKTHENEYMFPTFRGRRSKSDVENFDGW